MFNPIDGWFWNWFGWIFIIFSIISFVGFFSAAETQKGKNSLKIGFVCYVLLIDLISVSGFIFFLRNDFSFDRDFELFSKYYGDGFLISFIWVSIFNLIGIFVALALATERVLKIRNYLVTLDSLMEFKHSDGVITRSILAPEILEPNAVFEIKKIDSKKLEPSGLMIGFKHAEDLKAPWFQEKKQIHLSWFNYSDMGWFPTEVPENKPACVINYRIGTVEFYNLPTTSSYLFTVTY